MNQFNNFYFFHIDKTLGAMTAPHLIDPLYNIMEDNGISALNNNASHQDHNKWKDHGDDTYIFSVFINPISRIISEYAYESNYNEYGTRRHMGELREWQSPYVSLDGFKSWYKDYGKNNYQTAVLSSGTGNLDIAKKNFDRINFKVTTDLAHARPTLVRRKIFFDLGINHLFSKYNKDGEKNFYSEFVGPISSQIHSDRALINLIQNNNSFDQMLYDLCKLDTSWYTSL
jgi:hypothetical protein